MKEHPKIMPAGPIDRSEFRFGLSLMRKSNIRKASSLMIFA